MKLSLSAADLADALLRANGQNSEYPYLTEDRMRKIHAHEVVVDDIEFAIAHFTTEGDLDRVRLRERQRSRDRRAAAASYGAM